MKLINLIILFLLQIHCYVYASNATSIDSMSNNHFTLTESEDIIKLEEDLAFFYNAKNPGKIAEHYILALQALENSELDPLQQKSLMLEALTQAYTEVKSQTSLSFSPEKAALYEYDLIAGQKNKMSFESLCFIMISLYREIYGIDSPEIEKAANLRTFLYMYKIQLLNSGQKFTDDDMAILRTIDKASKSALSKL